MHSLLHAGRSLMTRPSREIRRCCTRPSTTGSERWKTRPLRQNSDQSNRTSQQVWPGPLRNRWSSTSNSSYTTAWHSPEGSSPTTKRGKCDSRTLTNAGNTANGTWRPDSSGAPDSSRPLIVPRRGGGSWTRRPCFSRREGHWHRNCWPGTNCWTGTWRTCALTVLEMWCSWGLLSGATLPHNSCMDFLDAWCQTRTAGSCLVTWPWRLAYPTKQSAAWLQVTK